MRNIFIFLLVYQISNIIMSNNTNNSGDNLKSNFNNPDNNFNNPDNKFNKMDVKGFC